MEGEEEEVEKMDLIHALDWRNGLHLAVEHVLVDGAVINGDLQLKTVSI